MPSIAPPSWLEHMSALPFTLCDISRAYQICHPRSLLGDDSVANAPACQVRFDHRAVPAGSFESRLSSQTLSPCRWHHRLALTVIRWPSNAIQTGELSTCGQEGATPIILSALFSVNSLFTFHIPFTLKLPATSLALFWLCFICLLVFFFIFLNPSSHSRNYNQGLRGENGFVFVWPCSSSALKIRPQALNAWIYWTCCLPLSYSQPSVQTFKKQAHRFDICKI